MMIHLQMFRLEIIDVMTSLKSLIDATFVKYVKYL